MLTYNPEWNYQYERRGPRVWARCTAPAAPGKPHNDGQCGEEFYRNTVYGIERTMEDHFLRNHTPSRLLREGRVVE